MQFVKEVADLPVEGILSILARSDAPFEPSELYLVASGAKVVDTTQRVSVFRRLRDDALFAACDALVRTLSAADPRNAFTLIRNDVTHIVYSAGGFFSSHRDFLSITSNVVEEYTLLVCVTPPAGLPTAGGATRVAVNPLLTLDSAATTTPGRGLLFRKDLRHEGLPVESGEKHIISLNLWATRKADAGPVLCVTFPKEAEEGADAAAAPLQAVADARSYAISLAALRQHPGCVLNTVAELKQQELLATSGAETASSASSSPAPPLVLTYECRACSYADFAVVFRALSGMYIRAADLVAGARSLLFFGVRLEALLVDVANAVNGGADGTDDAAAAAAATAAAAQLCHGLGEHCCDACGRTASQMKGSAAGADELRGCTHCTARAYCSTACADANWAAGHAAACGGTAKPKGKKSGGGATTKKKARADDSAGGAGASAPPPLADADIITCTSDERTRVVLAAAAALALPYIRFRALFVEGTLSYEGDVAHGPRGPTAALRMQPVWVSLGDYDSVLLVRNLCHTGDTAFNAAAATRESDYSTFWGDLAVAGGRAAPPQPGGRPALPAAGADIAKCVTRDVHEGGWGGDDGFVPTPVLRLPGGDDVPPEQPHGGGALFHLDSHGAACFTAAEAAAATARLVVIGFIGRVQARIRSTTFQLPQVYEETVSGSFCNEEVYGHCNFIEVTGAVRLAGGAAE